jgi:hypothetical protein
MAVQKFRTFDEARRALWLSPDDPRLLLRMKRLGSMARSRRAIQRGVTRVRSIEEAKRDKGAAWQVRPDL